MTDCDMLLPNAARTALRLLRGPERFRIRVDQVRLRERLKKRRLNMRGRIALGIIGLFVFLFIVFITPLHAEEGTVKAMSAWQSQGELFKVGENKGYFIGAFGGIMFIEDKRGSLDAANLLCPGTMDVTLEDGSTDAEGKCIISDREDNLIFAKWNCEGIMLEGCVGRFDIISGTGKFEGITGNGDFFLRTAISELAMDIPMSGIQATSAGLALWPKLYYKFP